MATQGYLLIADISGYTVFLSESELEHAQETLQELLELLIEHTSPPLIISRLAGDAVISYGLQGRFFSGQTFVEKLESTYVAFRKAIELMVLNNTCKCNACANVSALDLKFFVHYGTFTVQSLSPHDELVGNDVNLIHRLLKNDVTEKIGLRAYSLYTNAALQQLGLDEFRERLVPHSEEVEHLGKTDVWVQDMDSVWEAKRDASRVTVAPEDAVIQVEAHIEAPPEVVWDYLMRPEHRKVLIGSDRQEVIDRTDGRVAPGSVYQCYHGDQIMLQTILEWRPFEQIVTDDVVPTPFGDGVVLGDYRLEPSALGTRLIQAQGHIRGPILARAMLNIYGRMVLRKNFQRDIEIFKQHVEDDLQARGGLPREQATVMADAIEQEAAASLTR